MGVVLVGGGINNGIYLKCNGNVEMPCLSILL